MRVQRMMKNKGSLPLNLNLANAYPAIVQKRTLNTVDRIDINKEFHITLGRFNDSFNVLAFSSKKLPGNKLGGTLSNLPEGIVEPTSIQ